MSIHQDKWYWVCWSCSFYDTSIKDREGNLIFKTEWIAPTIVDLDEIVDKCYDANKIIKKYADGLYYLLDKELNLSQYN